jgi:hypothetical protein
MLTFLPGGVIIKIDSIPFSGLRPAPSEEGFPFTAFSGGKLSGGFTPGMVRGSFRTDGGPAAVAVVTRSHLSLVQAAY